jgi:hypothetical protein
MKRQWLSTKVSYWLFGLTFFLNIIGLAARVIERLLGYNNTELVKLVDVSEEANITSWFSSSLLLLSALILLLIARLKLVEKDRYARHWAFLSFIFFFLSLDETAGLHELTIRPLRSLFSTSGIFYYAWVVVAIPIVLSIGFLYLRFVFSLPSKTRNNFILAGILFLVGAVGFEMVEGLYRHSEIAGMYFSSIFVTIEELLENLGVVVFILALLAYIKLLPNWKNNFFEIG